MHDMDLTSGDGLTHLLHHKGVLWPFGHGLSYTTLRILGHPQPCPNSNFGASILYEMVALDMSAWCLLLAIVLVMQSCSSSILPIHASFLAKSFSILERGNCDPGQEYNSVTDSDQ